MELQNGYKKVYEKVSDGKRTFYATETEKCDTAVDTVLGSFIDSNYRDKTIYEYKGKLYTSASKLPKYNEVGEPAEGETEITVFNTVFAKVDAVEDAESETTTTNEVEEVHEEEDFEDDNIVEDPTE